MYSSPSHTNLTTSAVPSSALDVSIHLVSDNIRSAYNIGSFFRTCDAAGSTMLHICGISAYPPNPKLEKTALGALDSVPWKYHKNTLSAVEELKKQGIPVYAVERTPSSVDYRTVEYPEPVALVLGHELHGVNQLILDQSDQIIHIPMRGKKSSLNVATAAGIILFEAMRDRPG